MGFVERSTGGARCGFCSQRRERPLRDRFRGDRLTMQPPSADYQLGRSITPRSLVQAELPAEMCRKVTLLVGGEC